MTGSKMAKVGLREQNRLSGANRNTLIAGGIMANTAEIFNFPVPDAAQKEPRVADLDDGYTRIANELLEAVMLAGLTQHQLLVFLAVMRKTYGFNKKLDWVSNEQLSELTGILPHKCSAAKSVLVKRGIFIQSGRNTGINNVVSEWSTLPESGKKNKVYLKEVNLPESGKKSLPKSGTGIKPPDLIATIACSACHDEIDRRTHFVDAGYAKECALEGMARTQVIWLKEGVIKA